MHERVRTQICYLNKAKVALFTGLSNYQLSNIQNAKKYGFYIKSFFSPNRPLLVLIVNLIFHYSVWKKE